MSLQPFFEQLVVIYFRVADLRRSLDFYEGKLGFKRVYVSEEISWAELSFGAHRRPHLSLNRYTPTVCSSSLNSLFLPVFTTVEGLR